MIACSPFQRETIPNVHYFVSALHATRRYVDMCIARHYDAG